MTPGKFPERLAVIEQGRPTHGYLFISLFIYLVSQLFIWVTIIYLCVCIFYFNDILILIHFILFIYSFCLF